MSSRAVANDAAMSANATGTQHQQHREHDKQIATAMLLVALVVAVGCRVGWTEDLLERE
jgi:hypothetical protein